MLLTGGFKAQVAVPIEPGVPVSRVYLQDRLEFSVAAINAALYEGHDDSPRYSRYVNDAVADHAVQRGVRQRQLVDGRLTELDVREALAVVPVGGVLAGQSQHLRGHVDADGESVSTGGTVGLLPKSGPIPLATFTFSHQFYREVISLHAWPQFWSWHL